EQDLEHGRASLNTGCREVADTSGRPERPPGEGATGARGLHLLLAQSLALFSHPRGRHDMFMPIRNSAFDFVLRIRLVSISIASTGCMSARTRRRMRTFSTSAG